jgi:predicted DNA-binding transcriptional regulator YafY
MGKSRSKFERDRDRMAREQLIVSMLHTSRQGLNAEELATRCGVHKRTIYRDIIALESMGVPICEENHRYSLMPGSTLPPVLFTMPEAMAIFMAARLLLQQSSVYNHDIETSFTKLAGVVPQPLRDDFMKTLQWMQRRRVDDTAAKKLNIVSTCWTERRQVHIRYLPLSASVAVSRIIEPYFIQPSALARAVYVIAHCRLRNDLRVFRLDRILDARALETSYEIPEWFDANEYLSGYWSVTATGTPRIVKLRFQREIARIATETVWHDSQVTEAQIDGSVIVTMRLAITYDLVSFVLGWADMVEVIEPPALQRDVAKAARKIQAMYERQSGTQPEAAQGSSSATATSPSEEPSLAGARTDGRQLALFPAVLAPELE